MSDIQLAKNTLSLINRKGKSIIFNSNSTGTFNPVTRTVDATSQAYPIKAIVRDTGSTNLVNGTLVRMEIKDIKLASLSMPAVPEANDVVTIDGFNYAVYSVNQIFSGEVSVLFELKAKKA